MSDFNVELGYLKGKPVMKLQRRKQLPTIHIIGQKTLVNCYIITMEQLHWWSEEHNATFEEHLYRVGHQIMAILDLGKPNTRKLAEIASAIQARIDEFVKMPPLVSEQKTVGQAIVNAAGETFEHDILEKVDDGYKQYRH